MSFTNRATAVILADHMNGAVVADRVVLDYDYRYRRRLLLQTAAGRSILLDLSEARHLRNGDGLLVDDGTIILVEAKPEPVMDIGAATLAGLVRIAWHLGNRHLPTQLLDHGLRIREDHVIAELIQGLGGTVISLNAAFDPEGGAYGASHVRGHAHDHE